MHDMITTAVCEHAQFEDLDTKDKGSSGDSALSPSSHLSACQNLEFSGGRALSLSRCLSACQGSGFSGDSALSTSGHLSACQSPGCVVRLRIDQRGCAVIVMPLVCLLESRV